jgi:nucleoside-diphosphate kinase
MAIERTFSIIKPDATRRNLTGAINAVRKGRPAHRRPEARAVSRPRPKPSTASTRRPFFNDLVSFMTSGPIVVQVLEGENAVAKYRE